MAERRHPIFDNNKDKFDEPFTVDYSDKLKPRPSLDSAGVPNSFSETLAGVAALEEVVQELYDQLERGGREHDYPATRALIEAKRALKQALKKLEEDYDVELAWRNAEAANNQAEINPEVK